MRYVSLDEAGTVLSCGSMSPTTPRGVLAVHGLTEVSEEVWSVLQQPGQWRLGADGPELLPPAQPSNAELAAAARRRRDALLAGCDWTQHQDVGDEASRAAWAAYRRLLRALTDQPGFPGAFAWPSPPPPPPKDMA